jgi:hypothetical protein
MASQSKSHVFLLPALIDDIPKHTSPRKTKVENAHRARAFGWPFSLGPRRNSHGFTKLNSCLSSTSVDRRYPQKTQVPERQRLKMLSEPGLLAGPFPLGHGGITHGFTKLNSCQLLRLVRSLAVLLLLTYFSLTICSFHLGRRASLLV